MKTVFVTVKTDISLQNLKFTIKPIGMGRGS